MMKSQMNAHGHLVSTSPSARSVPMKPRDPYCPESDAHIWVKAGGPIKSATKADCDSPLAPSYFKLLGLLSDCHACFGSSLLRLWLLVFTLPWLGLKQVGLGRVGLGTAFCMIDISTVRVPLYSYFRCIFIMS